MGQLEAYGVNEMYLSGMLTGLCGTYIAEEHESDSFESFKSYVYSAAIFMKLKKNKKLFKEPLLVITKDGAQYASWSIFKFGFKVYEITKLVDDFSTWQDASLVDIKIDGHVLKLQDRYNW
jgi:hypothetical protein